MSNSKKPSSYKQRPDSYVNVKLPVEFMQKIAEVFTGETNEPEKKYDVTGFTVEEAYVMIQRMYYAWAALYQKHITVKQEAEKKAETQAVAKPLPTRVKILNAGAALTTGARNESYGDPVVNMQHMAGLLTAYFKNLIHGKYNKEGKPEIQPFYRFTGEDAAQIMVMAKLSRTANRGVAYHEDNYIDAATYSAMAGECAERERNG